MDLLRHKRVIDRNVSDDGWGYVSGFLVHISPKDNFALSFLQHIADPNRGLLADKTATDTWFGWIAFGVKI